MTQSFTVELLHGLSGDGRRHTVAEMRDATGHDQVMLAELGSDATPAERVSATIANLVLRIGDIKGPTRTQLLGLTVGDRERLVLSLCARLFGPGLELVATCPAPTCRGLCEIPIRLDDVVSISRDSERTAERRIVIQAEDGPWTALCRPPVGTDLEKAARGGVRAARELILDCILDLADPGGRPVAPARIPSECEADVAEALCAFDPVAECLFQIECPSCAQTMGVLLDGFSLLSAALGTTRRIYGDVYRMARSYHWSEAEILSLTLRRRRAYLAIADASEVQ